MADFPHDPVQRYALLAEMTQLVTTELDRTTFYQHALGILKRYIGYDTATVYLLHDESRLERVAQAGDSAAERMQPDHVSPPLPLHDQPAPLVMQRAAVDQPWDAYAQNALTLSWMGLPLRYAHMPMGLLVLESCAPDAYRHLDTDLLRLVGQQIGLRMRNTRLFDARESGARERTIINETLQAISGKLGIAALSETILDAVREITDSTRGAIFYPSAAEPDVLEIHHAYGMTALEKTKQFPTGEGIAGWVYQHGKPRNVSDSTKEPDFKRFSDVAEYPRSLLVVPIQVGERTIGVISAENNAIDHFGPTEVAWLSTLGVQIGVAVQRQRMLDTLNRLIAQLLTATDAQTLLELLLRGMIALLADTPRFEDQYSGVVFLAEDTVNEDNLPVRLFRPVYEYPAGVGYTTRANQPGEPSLLREVVRSGKRLVINEWEQDTRMNPAFRHLGIRSLVGVPLRDDQGVLGAFFLNSRQANDFTEARVALLEALAAQAVAILRNIRLRATLQGQQDSQARYLEEISQTILRLDSTNEDDMLRRILSITRALFRQPLLTEIRLAEGSERDLVVRCRVPEDAPFVQDHRRLPWGKGVAGTAADTGRVSIIPDVWKDTNYVHYVRGTKSEMVIPFRDAKDEVIGIINIEHGELNAFSDADIPLGNAVARLAQVAMNKARQLRLMQDLRELQTALAEEDNLQALFRLVLEKALKVTDAHYGSIHLTEDDKRTLTLVHYLGFPSENVRDFKTYIGESRGVTALAAGEARTIIIDNTRDAAWRDIFVDVTEGAVASAMAVPMMIAPFGVVGVINLEAEDADKFTEQHKRLIEQLAEVAAIAYKYNRMAEHAILSQAVGWMGLQAAEFDHELSQSVRAIHSALDGLDNVTRARIADAEVASALHKGMRIIASALNDMRSFTDGSQLPALPDIDQTNGPCEKQRRTAIDAVIDEMIAHDRVRHKRLYIIFQPGCPQMQACIDERWFRAAIGKLLHNAYKVTEDRKYVRVRTRRENQRIMITIRDEGRGIPATIRPYFLKTSVPRHAGSPGSGMGALLAKFIAQRYGGNVTLVETEEGRGTTLCLELPLV